MLSTDICAVCSQAIQYKMICGVRVYTTDAAGNRIYDARCGCSEIKSGPSPVEKDEEMHVFTVYKDSRELRGFRVRVSADDFTAPELRTVIEVHVDPRCQAIVALSLIQQGLFHAYPMPCLGWGLFPFLKWLLDAKTDSICGRLKYCELESTRLDRKWLGTQQTIRRISEIFS